MSTKRGQPQEARQSPSRVRQGRRLVTLRSQSADDAGMLNSAYILCTHTDAQSVPDCLECYRLHGPGLQARRGRTLGKARWPSGCARARPAPARCPAGRRRAQECPDPDHDQAAGACGLGLLRARHRGRRAARPGRRCPSPSAPTPRSRPRSPRSTRTRGPPSSTARRSLTRTQEPGSPAPRSPRSTSPRSPHRRRPTGCRAGWWYVGSRPQRAPRPRHPVRHLALPRVLHRRSGRRHGHRHRGQDPPRSRGHQAGPCRPEERRAGAPAVGYLESPGWCYRHRVQPHPRRRDPDQAEAGEGDHRDHPSPTRARPGSSRPPCPTADPAPTGRLAVASRMAPTPGPCWRLTTNDGDELTTSPPGAINEPWNTLTARSGDSPRPPPVTSSRSQAPSTGPAHRWIGA
jgi:hypothetical protein